MLDSQGYVELRGRQCPNCGANAISATDTPAWNVGSEKLCQEVACDNCSALWVEHYTLSGYDSLDTVEGR